MGCYVEKAPQYLALKYNFDLKYSNRNINPMSTKGCIDHCRKMGFLYAGINDKYICYCDNSFGSYGTSSVCGDCNCFNPSEKCGCDGTFDNSNMIYNTSSKSNYIFLIIFLNCCI